MYLYIFMYAPPKISPTNTGRVGTSPATALAKSVLPVPGGPTNLKGTKGFMEGITENHNNQKADMCRLMKHTGSCWKKNLEKSLVFQKKAITAKNPWHVWVVLGDLSNFK